MISAALFSPALVYLLTASQIACVLACILGIVLWLNPRWRQISGRRRWAQITVFVLLSVISLPYLASEVIFGGLAWQYLQDRAARNITLDTSRHIQGVDMPAGTRLRLRKAHRPDTFEFARFPFSVPVYGFASTRIDRSLILAGDGQHYVPTRAILALARDQQWAGWRCAADQPLAIELPPAGRPARIVSCTLAAGNTTRALHIPVGTEIRASKGTMYTSGRRGADRWILSVKTDQSIATAGARFSGRIMLDAACHLINARGALAAPLSLGGIHYPAGTSLRIRYDRSTGVPTSWQLSPDRGQRATREHASDISFGTAVAHDGDGTIRRLLTNAEAGFHHIRPLR